MAVMQHSGADVVRQALIDLGFVGDIDAEEWPAFVGSEPDGDQVPDNVVTFYNTSGSLFPRAHSTLTRIEYPGVQIRIRAENELVGYKKGADIANALDSLTYIDIAVDLTEYTIHTFIRDSGVISLGKDTPNGMRSLFTINGTVSYALFRLPGPPDGAMVYVGDEVQYSGDDLVYTG